MRDIKNVIDYAKMANDAYNEKDNSSKYKDGDKEKYISSENTRISRIFVNQYAGDVDVSMYKKTFVDLDGLSKDELIVSFGGSNSADDGGSDALLGLPYFNSVFNEIQSDVLDKIKKEFSVCSQITAVGHSLGGCYAELFASSFYSDLESENGKKVDLFTFNGLGASKGVSVYQAEIKKNGSTANKDEDPKEISDSIGIYKKSKIGVAEHYSNSKDFVSTISDHLSGAEYSILSDNFFGKVLTNHSIERIISDLEIESKKDKEKRLIVLEEYSGIEPEDYSIYFNGEKQAIKIMDGFVEVKAGNNKGDVFIGNGGNSFFEGGVGNDQLIGGDGNDFLSGGVGQDILADTQDDIAKMKSQSSRTDSGNKYVGGKEDDTIIDTAGNDTIFYNKGDGHDLMVLSETLRDSDKIIFGEDIKPGDLGFTVSGDKMVMHIAKGKDKEGSLTFDNWFTSKETSAQKVELFVFKDGTELTWQQINEMALNNVIFGTDSNNELIGRDDVSNIIFGMSGDDKIKGSNKHDTLLGGSGDDVLSDRFDGNKLSSNIYIGGKGNDTIFDTYGDDKIIYELGDGNDILLMNSYQDQDRLIFGDGITLSELNMNFNVRDLVLIIGKNSKNEGSIKINGWMNTNTQSKKIEFFEFKDGTIIDWKEMTEISINKNNTGGDGNDVLKGVDFMGNTMNGNGGNDTITGSSSADTINGGSGDDIIDGANSHDVLIGGDGNDTLIDSLGSFDISSNNYYGGHGNDSIADTIGNDEILYNKGDGHDILKMYAAKDKDKIVFGEGISKSDLSFLKNNNDLIISLFAGESAFGSITIESWFLSVSSQDRKIEFFEFNNGDVIDWKEVNNIAINKSNTGGEGNDNITGIDFIENNINGNGGNDKLIGSSKSDTINGGSGDDIIDGHNGHDILVGGDGNDRLFDSLDWFEISSNTYNGGRGNDVITDTIGNDVFLYNLGDGHDTLKMKGVKDYDKIIFGKGISKSSLSFRAADNNLVIDISSNSESSGSITIENWFSYPKSQDGKIEEFEFSDGAVEKWNTIFDPDAVLRKSSLFRQVRQYDLLSQEMASSDADAEPTIDYNKQSQDLYAYIEH